MRILDIKKLIIITVKATAHDLFFLVTCYLILFHVFVIRWGNTKVSASHTGNVLLLVWVQCFNFSFYVRDIVYRSCHDKSPRKLLATF